MNNIEEHRDEVNQRLADWSSKQGIFHQLVGGGRGFFSTVLKLLSLCGVLLLIAAVVALGYSFFRVGSDGFKSDLEQGLTKVFRAEELSVKAISKDGSRASIGKVDITGSEESYFSQLKGRNLTFQVSPLIDMIGEWDAGVINLNKFEIDLKSGAEDDGRAREVYQSLFANYGNVKFSRVVTRNATFNWGESPVEKGSIKGSQLIATRDGDVWKLEFQGGKFSHQWVRDVDIDNLTVICSEEGVEITEAHLTNGEGRLDFQARISVGRQPKVSGVFELTSMPVASLLSDQYSNSIKGAVSGKGTLSGAFNTQKGVLAQAHLVLGENDPLTFFSTVPLLDALSVIDIKHSYRKVVFSKGSLDLQVAGSMTSFENINISSENELDLVGNFDVRPLSYQEVADELELELEDVEKAVGVYVPSFEDAESNKDDVEDSYRLMEIRKASVERELRYSYFIGSLKASLHAGAFNKSPRFQQAYPVDASTGKVHLNIPLKGAFSSLTQDLHDELFEMGKKQ